MYNIYSTLANNNEYVRYSEHGPQGINIAERAVLINGGSGVASKKHLGTPLGMHTAVPDDDFEWLKDNFSFKQHMKNGYIRVEKQKVDPEAAAADMVTRNQKTDACPIVPQDFIDNQPEKDGLTPIKPVEGKKRVA